MVFSISVGSRSLESIVSLGDTGLLLVLLYEQVYYSKLYILVKAGLNTFQPMDCYWCRCVVSFITWRDLVSVIVLQWLQVLNVPQHWYDFKQHCRFWRFFSFWRRQSRWGWAFCILDMIIDLTFCCAFYMYCERRY